MLFLVERHGPDQPPVVLQNEVTRGPARILGHTPGLLGGQQEFVAQERVRIARKEIPRLRRDVGDSVVDG